MGKITYWLRKLGILRTATYTAKNSEELNEAATTDGGMVQTQKEIDEKYRNKKTEVTQNSVEKQ